MAGYVIANYSINDREKYEKYPPAAGPTLQQYGGKMLVVEDNAKTQGSPHQVIVVIEFESLKAAKRWYESPEYKAIKHLREEATEGWVAFAPGFEMPGG